LQVRPVTIHREVFMRRPTLPALVFLAVIPAACAAPVATTPPPAPPPAADPAPPPQQACTRIGCEDGWSVELAGATALPATYTIRVIVDGTVVASRECSAAQPCGDRVFLAGVTAAQADLEIIGGAAPLRWTVTPEYSTLQPNGPGCPPTCRQARVAVRMGGEV
jgi:hypothetical protein